MIFLEPIWLAASAAVSVPILFHLLQRRRVRVVQWAAMRFLLSAMQETRRRTRLQELLLLAVRCMILAALSLAFARPRLESEAGGIAGLGRRDRLLVVDRSMSMGARFQGLTLLERAKEASLQLLDRAGPNDRYALLSVPAPDGATGFLPLGTAPERLRAFLRDLTPAATPFSWGAFWAGIGDLFGSAGGEGAGAEVLFLTDLQEGTWGPDALAGDLPRWKEWTASGLWRVVVFGEEQENVAVVEPRLPAGVPVAQVPQTLSVRVARFGGTGERSLSVSLEGPDAPSPRTVRLDPDASAWVQFPLLPKEAGHVVYRARIESDALAADDELPVVLPVSERIVVQLVDGEPGAGSALDAETAFLAVALEDEPGRPARWTVRRENADAFTVEAVEDADAVVLANVSSLPAALAERLRTRVREGMGLVHFMGDRTDVAFWSASPLAPGAITGPVGGLRTEGPYWEVVPLATAHPVLRSQREPESFLDRALVWGRWNLDWAEISSRGGEVILGLQDGAPYMVQHGLGEGAVLTVLGSADQEWNNLATNADFVPWVLETVQAALRAGLGRWNRPLGTDVTIPILSAWVSAEVAMRLPSGGRERLTPHQGEGGTWNVHPRPLTEPGVYRLLVDGRETRAVAVRSDAGESDLRRADAGQLARLLPKLAFEEGAASLAEGPAGGADLTQPFLYLALALACIEVLIARRSGNG